MRCVIDGNNLSTNDVVELFKTKKNFSVCYSVENISKRNIHTEVLRKEGIRFYPSYNFDGDLLISPSDSIFNLEI